MSKKREFWLEEECLALLSAWRTEEIQRKLKATYKNSDIYKKVTDMMKKKGQNRDWTQCRTKFKHMKTEYKKYKDALSRSGAGRSKEPKYFDIKDGFLGDRPEAEGLKNNIDTFDDTLENENIVDDDELIQKYGEGRIVERECPKCNEMIEVKTAGAHVGNSIAVYSDDDNLVCPNCGYTEQVHDEEDETSPTPSKSITPSTSCEKSKEGKIPVSSKTRSITGKGKPSKMQAAFENSMKEHNAYLKESDKNFLSEMKEQAGKERELRREELEAYKDSMALLANAITGRSQAQQQPSYYDIQHDINQQTYYKL